MATTVSMVPEVPTTMSYPASATSAPKEVEDGRGVLAAALDVLGLHRAAGEEALGEPDGAEPEAAAGQHVAALAEEQLGGAAADVAEQHPLVEQRERLQHAEVDQAGLLEARR